MQVPYGTIKREANTIKSLRITAGLSQGELAGMLYVSRDLVSKWETNKRRPSPEMLRMMSTIFGKAADEIFPIDNYISEELDRCVPKGIMIESENIPVILNTFLEGLPWLW